MGKKLAPSSTLSNLRHDLRMPNQIHQLVYVSDAMPDLSRQTVVDIAERAQISNKKVNVSGLLVFRNRQFLQLLEGDKFDVHFVFKKIRDDRRHSNIQILIDDPASTRLFTKWNMVLRELDGVESKLRDEIVEFLRNPPKPGDKFPVLQALWKFYGASIA